jgi:hypothetical protein
MHIRKPMLALQKTTVRFMSCTMLAAMLISIAPAHGQELTQQPGVLGYVHIDNPLRLVEEADAIGSKLGQSVSALLPLLGGSYLKSPGLQGIEMSKPMTFLFGLDPETGGMNVSFVLTTTSPDAYFQNFGKVFGTQMTEEGTSGADSVRQFKEVTTTFDHEGHMAAMERGENPSQADYQIETTTTWFTAVQGDQVLVSPDQQMAQAFTGNSAVLPADRIVPGSVLIGGQMQTLKGMIIAPLQLAMASAQLQAASDKSADNTQMEMLDLVVKATEQIEDIQIGADLINENLDLFVGLKAAEGSDVAKWISSVGSIDPAIINQLPANTSIAFAGAMPKVADMSKFIFNAIAPDTADQDAIDAYIKVLEQWDEVSTGQALGGLMMDGDQAAGVAYILGVKDGAKAREVAASIYDSKTQGSIMQMMMGLGGTEVPEDLEFTYTKDVGTLNGAPIDEFKMPLDEMIKAELEKNPIEQQAPEAAAVMGNLTSFMDMFSEMRFAFMPDRVLVASGPEKAKTLELLAKPSEQGPDVAQTLDFAPDDPAFIYHFPLDAYMNLILGLMPEEGLPQDQINTMKSIMSDVALSMYGKCKDRTGTFGIRYPISPIIEAFATLSEVMAGEADTEMEEMEY